MGKPLDHSLDGRLGAVRVARYVVANLHDGGPVFRGEILVCGLGCAAHVVSEELFPISSGPLGTVICGNIPMASS